MLLYLFLFWLPPWVDPAPVTWFAWKQHRVLVILVTCGLISTVVFYFTPVNRTKSSCQDLDSTFFVVQPVDRSCGKGEGWSENAEWEGRGFESGGAPPPDSQLLSTASPAGDVFFMSGPGKLVNVKVLSHIQFSRLTRIKHNVSDRFSTYIIAGLLIFFYLCKLHIAGLSIYFMRFPPSEFWPVIQQINHKFPIEAIKFKILS